ncbi:MAG: hypothetical protein U0163_05105 [Gemmatimonadaceae bacterium]
MDSSHLPRRGPVRRSATALGAVSVGMRDADRPSTTSPDPAEPSSGAAQAPARQGKAYNADYEGARLNRLAFPMGGLGAGMVCLEGTGALSHVSIRNEARRVQCTVRVCGDFRAW